MFKRIICSLILAMLLVSCEKELDFQYHEVERQLVIEGLLTMDGAKVTISYTTPMNEPIEKDYLTDAQVSLLNMDTSEEILLMPDKEGVFTGDLTPIVANNYGLKVVREGREYFSCCEMRPATKISALKFDWIKMPYDYVAVLQISFHDFESADDCYWIKVYRNDEPYKWIVTDDRGSSNGIITEVIMTTRKDQDKEDEKDILRDGDVVKVVINVVSREMYDYLIAIENDSNGPSMFEGDFCLGYFMASASTSDSIIFHP